MNSLNLINGFGALLDSPVCVHIHIKNAVSTQYDMLNNTAVKRIKVEGVVKVGDNLNEILKNRKTNISTIKIEIQKGDFFKEGKEVTHSILYFSKKSKLGLRMRYDEELDKFHIVGYSGLLE